MIANVVLIVFCSVCAAIHIVMRWSARVVVVYGIFSFIIIYIVVRKQKIVKGDVKMHP